MELILLIVKSLINNAPDLIGFILPPLIEYFNKRNMGEGRDMEIARTWVTIFTCIGAAIFVKFDSLVYGSPEEVLKSAAIIFTESQVIFKIYFKSSYVRQQIQKRIIEGQENQVEQQSTANDPSAPQK